MKEKQKIITALEAAYLALAISHNLTTTNRPYFPRERWPIHVLDHKKELELIDKVLSSLERG